MCKMCFFVNCGVLFVKSKRDTGAGTPLPDNGRLLLSVLWVVGLLGASVLTEHLHKVMQHWLGKMQRVVGAVVVRQLQYLFHGIDMKDAMFVDYILPPEAYKELLLGRMLGDGGFDFRQSEGYHEMGSRRIIDMCIMVVGLHIQHLGQIYHIHFAINVKT